MLSTRFNHDTGVVTSREGDGKFTFDNDTVTLGDGEIVGDFTVDGNTTLNGTYLTLGGLVTMTGSRIQIIKTGVTLEVANSGAVLIPGGTAQTFTLPAAAEGLHFKMYAGTAAAHKIQVPGGATERIYGNAININNAAAAAEGQQISNKTAVAFGVALQTGDFMELICDGSNWFLHAVTNDPLTLTP